MSVEKVVFKCGPGHISLHSAESRKGADVECVLNASRVHSHLYLDLSACDRVTQDGCWCEVWAENTGGSKTLAVHANSVYPRTLRVNYVTSDFSFAVDENHESFPFVSNSKKFQTLHVLRCDYCIARTHICVKILRCFYLYCPIVQQTNYALLSWE